MEDERQRRRNGDGAARCAHAGAQLAAAREAQGLPLSEAASRTHIKQDHLAAIEAMDASGLPPRPYALGFVKAYADFLGLEPAALAARFKDDIGYAAPSVHPTAEKFQAAQDAVQPASREMSLWAMLAVILFMLWCAWQIALPRDLAPPASGPAASGPAASGPAAAAIAPDVAPPVVTSLAPGGVGAEAPAIELRALDGADPVYPRTCDAGAGPVETVEVMFNVNAMGRVTGEQVIRSSNACFNDAALNAVRLWTFEPHRVEGAPRAVYDQRRVFAFDRPG